VSARLWLVIAIAVIPLLVYPIVSIAGGGPRFPTRTECVHAAVDGQPVAVVWGRYDDLSEASEARDRVITVGFVGTEVQPDGCGLWKVELGGVPSVEVANEIVEEAETVDLHPTLELDSDG
jgi:hypothetical protein